MAAEGQGPAATSDVTGSAAAPGGGGGPGPAGPAGPAATERDGQVSAGPGRAGRGRARRPL